MGGLGGKIKPAVMHFIQQHINLYNNMNKNPDLKITSVNVSYFRDDILCFNLDLLSRQEKPLSILRNQDTLPYATAYTVYIYSIDRQHISHINTYYLP